VSWSWGNLLPGQLAVINHQVPPLVRRVYLLTVDMITELFYICSIDASAQPPLDTSTTYSTHTYYLTHDTSTIYCRYLAFLVEPAALSVDLTNFSKFSSIGIFSNKFELIWFLRIHYLEDRVIWECALFFVILFSWHSNSSSRSCWRACVYLCMTLHATLEEIDKKRKERTRAGPE